MPLTIAIDGPVGAGKSSIADAVAKRLELVHLDTGAMYRALGFQAMTRGVNMDDEEALVSLLNTTEITVTYEDGVQRTLVNGGDVSALIRTPEAGMAASKVSRFAKVRTHMVHLQQEWCRSHDVVMDGRDIGTRVLPDASLKIFLTASPEERARRRFEEFQAKGDPTPYEKVLSDLKKRDEQDTTRKVEPLRAAEDAIVLDSTHMTFDQVVDHIVDLAHQAMEG
ncbi:MAG: (d)CMP kinase [Clostridia bacterium]|nr:(d)CMP kinase [Clostridia bacterium]